jgi:hypothetical protein
MSMTIFDPPPLYGFVSSAVTRSIPVSRSTNSTLLACHPAHTQQMKTGKGDACYRLPGEGRSESSPLSTSITWGADSIPSENGLLIPSVYND